jgi:thrombospondin type 3 repeat protein/galactose oxidase-like protein
MTTHSPSLVPRSITGTFALLLLFCAAVPPAGAACPPGESNPITSGTATSRLPVFFSNLGAVPRASFYALGAGVGNNSGTLPAIVWVVSVGDLDGDGRPEYRAEAPGRGSGGWGDARTIGCPSTLDPPRPPLVVLLGHEREDLDGDGAFDVSEDKPLKNGRLDPGEDLDGDGRLTPPDGCEGLLREDIDCDGHLDLVNEDANGNGVLDPGEDIDRDNRLDLGNEDRNHNQTLDDRPFPHPGDVIYQCQEGVTPCVPIGQLPASYPYGSFKPAPGGIVVASVAWSGSAYDLSAITTPTRTVTLPSQDLDGDGAFDVSEDRPPKNGRLDPGEDRDGDGRLTPPGGCEGMFREDEDCDGHLDLVDEDRNHNGRLDPGEDLDADRRLDDGSEDRNHNQILDDRPFPQPGDVIFECEPGILPCRVVTQLPPSYPYGTGEVRVLDATPLDRLTPRTSGVRRTPDGTWRMRFDVAGTDLSDDLGGTRGIFDRYRLSLMNPPEGIFPPPNRFVESGTGVAELVADGNGAAGSFLSLRALDPFEPFPGFGLSGTVRPPDPDVNVGLLAVPRLEVPDLLDRDGDGVPLPADNCPALLNTAQADADQNGLGDACDQAADPGAPPGDTWREVAAQPSPGPRTGAALAHDERRGVMVLFGGSPDAATWEFDGVAWNRIATAAAPEPRTGHRMIFNSSRGRVLLFGGRRLSDGADLGDLWEYDGASWFEIVTPISPPPRSDFGLAYDSSRHLVVLFGGRSGAGALGDTWVFDGALWRLVPSPRSPVPRLGAQMVYDAFRQVTVLNGGLDPAAGVAELNDTWEFDGETWQPADHRGEIPPTWNGTLAFDAARRQLLLFGGLSRVGVRSAPTPSVGAISAGAATRLYDGTTWSALPTRTTAPPRQRQAAALDAARGTLIVHGGISSVVLGDTWELVRSADTDADGVNDADDNCPLLTNADQADFDGDGSGDACDNCPEAPNPTQRDLDRDLAGDVCDGDIDGDGVANATDVCPTSYVAGRPADSILAGGGPDRDADGTADDCDRCPLDPLNDADRDGVCGESDNCPRAINPLQDDSNGDGAGDACQPRVRIESIEAVAATRLNARVALGDPDGDPLRGEVRIFATASLPDVLPRLDEVCSLMFLPEGLPGQGIVYAVSAGTTLLADADSEFHCADGVRDFVLAPGRCAGADPGSFGPVLVFDREAPFPICVRSQSDPARLFDYTVLRIGGDAALLGPVGPPLVVRTYDRSRLPRAIDVSTLPRPATYLLQVTAADGITPEISDSRSFELIDEETLLINQPRRGRLP